MCVHHLTSLQGDSANEQPERAEPQPAGGGSDWADGWDGGRREGRGQRRRGSREEQQHRESQSGIAQHHRDAQTATSEAAVHHQQVTHTHTHGRLCASSAVCFPLAQYVRVWGQQESGLQHEQLFVQQHL